MSKSRYTITRQLKQTGNTFFGIMLGLIIGLAIAVVVALYITRIPSRFVAQLTPTGTSDIGASESQYDPNRILQNQTHSQALPQAAAQPTPLNTAPLGQSTSNHSKSSDMLDNEPQIIELPIASLLSDARPSSATMFGSNALLSNQSQPSLIPKKSDTYMFSRLPLVASKVNSGYFLQIGAYKTTADAEQQRARLALQGFESQVTQRDAGGIIYYRVRIGPFSQFGDMNTTRQRLSNVGIDTAVIRFTKQKHLSRTDR